jgi:hypothetical protein
MTVPEPTLRQTGRLGRCALTTVAGSLYYGLFFSSANVRIDGVFVGIGTWASNFRDTGGSGHFRGWSRMQRFYSLVPANDLAHAISSNPGDLRDPGMTRAATFSQRCVGPSPTS